MTVTDPYTGIGVITRGVFDSDMAAISLSLHSSCNDIALNEKNSPSFCQIHFYRGIFHLLSSCTLSTLRAFNSSSFHPSSPQIHPFSMIPVTPQRAQRPRGFNPRTPCGVRQSSAGKGRESTRFQSTHSLRSATTGLPCDKADNIVSIHALLAECDLFRPPLLSHARCFNPRTPCGVRLFRPPLLSHARCFNPRTPCGVRRQKATCPRCRAWFQSTHSLRSATG